MRASTRKQGFTRPNRSIYIFCEGSKTEPKYISDFIKSLAFPHGLATVEVVKNKYTDLVGLVRLVKSFRSKNKSIITQGDEFWIVVDRDGYTLHPKGFDQAYANNICIAFSSRCFEYWLLLHYEKTSAAFHSCDDLIERLKKYIHLYEKGCDDIFKVTNSRFSYALSYAEHFRNQALEHEPNLKPYERSAYTDFDFLMLSLWGYSRKLKTRMVPK